MDTLIAKEAYSNMVSTSSQQRIEGIEANVEKQWEELTLEDIHANLGKYFNDVGTSWTWDTKYMKTISIYQ